MEASKRSKTHHDNGGEEQMNRWPDGLVTSPDGPAREIPQPHAYSRALFITKDGTARARIYNFVSQTWSWEDQPVELTLSEDGRVGIRDYAIGHWVPIEVAIALAWRKRSSDTPMRAYVLEGRPCEAKYIRWAEEDDTHDEQQPMTGESFKCLKWRVGLISCDGRGYKISNRGRLMSPDGSSITRGFYFDDRMWAAVKGVGLVDLTTAARLRPPIIHVPPAVASAADALYNGVSPEVFADDAGIQVGTAWSYYTRAALVLPPDRLREVTKQLVSGDLWHRLKRMDREEDPLLGGSLTDLMSAVENDLSSRGEFLNSEFQFEQLRLARSCLAKQA